MTGRATHLHQHAPRPMAEDDGAARPPLSFALATAALADLAAIRDRLTERAGPAARELGAIFAAIEQACLFPTLHPLLEDETGEVLGTRKLVEPRYRYVLYYRVEESELRVLRIFHRRQNRSR